MTELVGWTCCRTCRHVMRIGQSSVPVASGCLCGYAGNLIVFGPEDQATLEAAFLLGGYRAVTALVATTVEALQPVRYR